MKRLLGLLMSAAWMLLVSAGPELQAGESSSLAREVAFVGVNVVPMARDGVLNNQTVLVGDGRIAAVGPADSTTVPDGALRVEGRDKFLMPGLAEELQYMPRQQIEEWTTAQQNLLMNPTFKPDVAHNIIQNRMRLLKGLSDGGVNILLGSDAPQRFSVPGFSIHREMKRMADAGMKPYDIIKSGSYNVGVYFKDKDNFGTIETGKRADLILVEVNPLENVANIGRRAGVMVRGQWLPEQELQNRLAKTAASYKSLQ